MVGAAVMETTPAFIPPRIAAHLLEEDYDIRMVQQLLGHASMKTTMIYTHMLNHGGRAVCSPLNRS